MIELFGAPQNLPFAAALILMGILALLEGVGALVGLGFSALFDSILPDFDIDADVDAEVGGSVGPGVLTGPLSWLRVGRVPVLILFAVFLAAFGLIGLAGQTAFYRISGLMLPAAIAWIPATLLALPVVRGVGGVIARLLPKEETSAVSEKTFVGRVASVVLGTAAVGQPAEAKLRDEHGRTHYVMVEPESDDDEFSAGDAVLIVRADGARFRVIRPPTDSLLPTS